MDGSIESKYLSKYDETGKETEFAEYNGKDSLVSKETMKYNDKGKKIEEIVLKPDGSVDEKRSSYYDYEYDSTGNVIKKTQYEMKGGKKEAVRVTESEYVYY